MKKLIFCFLTLLTSGAAIALPVGNPAEASFLSDGVYFQGLCCSDAMCDPCFSWRDAFSARFGYYGDFVFNRKLELDENWGGRDIEKTRIITNAAYLAANFYDRFDFFGVFGGTHFLIDTNAVAFHIENGTRFKLETHTDFSWSVGGRATLFEWGCTSYGIEASYFHTRPTIALATLGEDTSDYPDHSYHLKYWEWQIALGISHRINHFLPYLAGKYSRGKINFENKDLLFTDGTVLTLSDLDTKRNGGFVIGVSYIDCEKMALTVEFRFPDEKALYVNGQIRF